MLMAAQIHLSFETGASLVKQKRTLAYTLMALFAQGIYHWRLEPVYRKTEEIIRLYADSFDCFTRPRYIYHWRLEPV